MSIERDKFLTEAIGECWHLPEKYDVVSHSFGGVYEFTRCSKCKLDWREIRKFNEFSSWDGFGKLYEWAELQPWFEDLLYNYWSCPSPRRVFPHHFIHPERFADALYNFLTGVYPSQYLVWKEKGRYDVKP